ncbi:hypothetical protein B0A48_03151 [Cryoendolithus antarcticus]|uniref:PRISE-like Rossmann-fold domain-containing protein n=1 Tax=Cryoendolithus antarcticus TaxID=1507870 RepID=A0A1V8TMA0_9PEZI|nr:hypothetical protein B0A48_03151 [Cryoendolithus antarcticus]
MEAHAPVVPSKSKEDGALTALVFGASGITGHAILQALLTHPSPTTFSRVVGLTNRPLSAAIAQLPADPRIELYSGIDLLSRESSLLQLQHVPGVDLVTHVFYAAYGGHGSSFEDLKNVNSEMLTNAVGGVEICCPKLQFITLNTGGKVRSPLGALLHPPRSPLTWFVQAYGVEFYGQNGIVYEPPLLESTPRIPSPHAEKVFYYAQHDILRVASEGKPWTFCEIRPDVIVGFVPNNNAMNMAQSLALYFSLYHELEGEGSEVVFPYGAESWEALHTDSSSDLLGRMHVHCATNPQTCGNGSIFNCVDGPPFAWSSLWPRLTAYFGLKGMGPNASPKPQAIEGYMLEHRARWPDFVRKHGLREGALEATGWKFADDVCGITFRRDMSSEARNSVGFTEIRDIAEGYERAFQEMRKARIIP